MNPFDLGSLARTSLATIGAILGAMALVAVLETRIPLRPRGADRRRTRANLALTFLTFATNIFLNGALVVLLARLHPQRIGVLYRLPLSPITSAVVAIVALDFSFYVAHVAMHKVPLFWLVHRVHHADSTIDVTTTIRQHPLEGLIRYAFMAAFACALGVGVGAFAIYRLASALNGLLEHANLRVPHGIDRALSFVTTWPGTHKIHHSRDPRLTDTNYGNLFSWFDRLFGTFTPPMRGDAIAYGLDGLDAPSMQTTSGLLVMPFVDPQRSNVAGRVRCEDAHARS